MEVIVITALSTFNRHAYGAYPAFAANKNKAYTSNTYFTPKFQNTGDVFIKSKNISFGSSEYNRQDAEKLIDDIVNQRTSTKTRGYQGEFFKLGENYGIKSINPLDKASPFADLQGINNAREYYVLNVIKNIDPEIATKPVDLIKKDNKYFLVTELINGVHPFNSTVNNKHLQNILKNSYMLDINGIAHSDLQSGNIFLMNNDKVKFIDFGAYQLLANNGYYVPSDHIREFELQNSFVKEMHNSPLEGKFVATFYNNAPKSHIIGYSDNPYLKIRSNASNFEYRMIYDFLSHDKAEQPKEFLTDYLKTKAEYYHKPMAEFLEKLQISPNDTAQIAQRDSAVQTEKLFAEVFSNPSENVLKSELEKIQLKWLMNDYQGGKTKAFDYFEKYLANIEQYSSQATENEKQYFNVMKKLLEQYKNHINTQEYKGGILTDSENLVKRIFEKVETVVKGVETAAATAGEQIIKNTKSNNKLVGAALGVVTAGSAVGLWRYKSIKKAG